MGIPEEDQPLVGTLKRVAYHLKQLGVPFALAGSFAVYARGGEPVDHDVDFVIRQEDAPTILSGLVEAGFRAEVPPEGWLVKVYDEDRLVDLIYTPVQRPVNDATLADVDLMSVNAVHMPVLSATELMIHKMLTWSAHHCDFARGLPVARSLREQIDWPRVRTETAHSPFAYAFLVLLDQLDVICLTDVISLAGTAEVRHGQVEGGELMDGHLQAQVQQLLAEHPQIGEQGIRIVEVTDGLVLVGDVESPDRCAQIESVVRETFPQLSVSCDLTVTRVNPPQEVERI